MSWTSILPENLSFVETFFTRLFLIFAFLTIGPWAFFILYDICLYIWRSVYYVIPFVGGRAQGRLRPRAPSLTEHPNGNRRRFTMASRATAAKSSPFADPAITYKDTPEHAMKLDEKIAPLVAVESN